MYLASWKCCTITSCAELSQNKELHPYTQDDTEWYRSFQLAKIQLHLSSAVLKDKTWRIQIPGVPHQKNVFLQSMDYQ